MKSDSLIPLALIALVAICFVGACSPSCTINPSIFRWERREPGEPWFPNWRKKRDEKKHAAPAETLSQGLRSALPGAAPNISPAHAAATAQTVSPDSEPRRSGG